MKTFNDIREQTKLKEMLDAKAARALPDNIQKEIIAAIKKNN